MNAKLNYIIEKPESEKLRLQLIVPNDDEHNVQSLIHVVSGVVEGSLVCI